MQDDTHYSLARWWNGIDRISRRRRPSAVDVDIVVVAVVVLLSMREVGRMTRKARSDCDGFSTASERSGWSHTVVEDRDRALVLLRHRMLSRCS